MNAQVPYTGPGTRDYPIYTQAEQDMQKAAPAHQRNNQGKGKGNQQSNRPLPPQRTPNTWQAPVKMVIIAGISPVKMLHMANKIGDIKMYAKLGVWTPRFLTPAQVPGIIHFTASRTRRTKGST